MSKNGLPRKPLTKRRLKNLILNVLKNPFNMVVLVSLIILFCLIIIPLLTMISSTFTLAQGELRRVQGHVGDFTLYYWKYILTGKLASAVLWQPLKNSFICGFFTVLVSVPLGSVLAWLMIRTDLPGKKILGLLVTVPYMIPSWTKALAWLAMFRNSTSGANGFLAGLGIPVPDWLAYGPIAIVLCMSMHYYAFSYIMVSGALRSINSELEEMGEIQGASKAQILRHITLPLILPSVLSATVMTISKSIGTYGVPANLGNRIGYYTLATKMRNFIDQGPQAVGYAMSIVLVLLAALIIFSNQRIVGVRKSYATVSGKGGRATLMQLGKAKKPLMVFLMVFLFLAMVVPFFVLIMETFQITTGAGYGPDNLTLYNWIGKAGEIDKYTNYVGIFRNPNFFSAFWNTIRLTLIASILTAICGQFLGYISSRGRGKWYGDLTEQMVFVPYLMSGIAFSTMYFSMFSRPHFGGLMPSLYGTFTLIVLTSVVKHFPFASKSGTANMLSISVELEEAADIAGASFWKRMSSIIVPLAKNGFISGFMLTFISIAKELDLIIIMMTPTTQTMSYLAFTYSQEGYNQMSDAVSVCVLAFILVCYIVANRFGADLNKSM
ncbi:iron ABC transporter permease [Dysosmobacter sp.]|uniref:ABC transporter permease n=1 Tax=Dysosmobacter sp. TaxID=2591382 RepID=UPI002A795945|nr:iron ABC transporter permease [Dysosmobacter sp.]MCI7214620.1 iron ABC transporter permease [Dysosmobacter sp.]MDY2966910.1 iron ABC transporter permease [Vescimonas coprocola]MDY3652229.1 iron ABC transporter permease [Dysosmobacter sp.]